MSGFGAQAKRLGLSPSQLAVLNVLRARPDGTCRRDFARLDIFEPSKRIGELRDAGFVVDADRWCNRHRHRSRMKEYRLVGWPERLIDEVEMDIHVPLDDPDVIVDNGDQLNLLEGGQE